MYWITLKENYEKGCDGFERNKDRQREKESTNTTFPSSPLSSPFLIRNSRAKRQSHFPLHTSLLFHTAYLLTSPLHRIPFKYFAPDWNSSTTLKDVMWKCHALRNEFWYVGPRFAVVIQFTITLTLITFFSTLTL